MKNQTKIQFLNSTQLKLLAAFLMVLDHIHQTFIVFNPPLWLTYLGRLVFPLFLFTLAEGFYYTKNRKQYLLRLLYGSWGMTVLTTALQIILPNDNVVLMNNAFTTLFLTGVYIWIWDRFLKAVQNRQWLRITTSILLALIPIIAAIPSLLVVTFTENLSPQITQVLLMASLLIPNILLAEGGFLMILLGVVFYICRDWRWLQIGALCFLSFLVYLSGNHMQSFMAAAAIPMLLYNGQRGKGLKSFFYIFYPVHLTILYIGATLLSRLI